MKPQPEEGKASVIKTEYDHGYDCGLNVEQLAEKQYPLMANADDFSYPGGALNSFQRIAFKAGYAASKSTSEEEKVEIINGYTQLMVDRRSLPKDGQHIKFMTETEEWYEGYFVAGDDIFHVTDSKFFFKWHVQQWKEI